MADLSSALHAAGMSIADEGDPNFVPIAALPERLASLHLTFVNEAGILATFGQDNAENLRSWWLVQCAKLSNPDRVGFWVMLTVREFTKLRDPLTRLPIKRLSACVFRNGVPFEPLLAAETRHAFSVDATTGKTLPQRSDIVFVDFQR